METVRDADIVVLGSGVAGLTAALCAAIAGLEAVVLEHAHQIGGTSARSSGTVWIPDSPYLREAGVTDDRDKAEAYLAALVGNRGAPEMWRAFLDEGPRMLAHLRAAGITFKPFMASPDYRQDQPGAAPGGRALEPAPFDGRALGPWFERLASPLPELMLFGRMMVTRPEAASLVTADQSLAGAALGARLLARYAVDRLSHARGTRLVLGNALVARLLKACLDRGVMVLTAAEPRALTQADGRINGVEVRHEGTPMTITARRGVVLAGGGFPASPARRAAELPEPTARYTPAAPGCDGTTIALAEAVGAALGPAGLDNALWFPSSVAKRPDGSDAVYPHIVLDRGKPGVIAVDQTGRRFTNEAISYHDFVRAMYRANAERPTVPAFLLADATALKRYGLGMVRPRGIGRAKRIADGSLVEAATLAELASRIGVDPGTLEETVARYNTFAAIGRDADFGKGETTYDRAGGDPSHGPNPCIGPLATPPFYAVTLHPTPLGTSRGLAADTSARVLSAEGRPIAGLYVSGNDMQSAFGGEYPGAGGQLGPAMTFAFIAIGHALGTAPRETSALAGASFGSEE